MKTFIRYLVITVLLLGYLSYYIPTRYNVTYPKSPGPELDTHVRHVYTSVLNQERPNIFLLGDSMPGRAINEKVLGELLGEKVHLASIDGSSSAVWYLIIKNNIAISEHKPKQIVIFFRDSILTVPGYRVNGSYFELVDEYASSKDLLLVQRAFIDQMTPLERIMDSYMPVFGSRFLIREHIDRYIRYPLDNVLLRCDQKCVDQAMEVVLQQDNFDLEFLSEAIDSADNYLYTKQALNFKKQIDKSFLPEMIRLCKENGISLIFVRMPIHRFYIPGTKPADLDGYIQELSGYLRENDIPLLDFDDKTMPVEFYGDSLHLNNNGKTVFTTKLGKALKGVIK